MEKAIERQGERDRHGESDRETGRKRGCERREGEGVKDEGVVHNNYFDRFTLTV